MDDHQSICPNEKIVATHTQQIAELYEHGRMRESRLTEMETVLFGAERDGGGYIKMHEQKHCEEKAELREVLDVLRHGQTTQSQQTVELERQVRKLTERNAWAKFVELLKVAAPLAASAAALAVALK